MASKSKPTNKKYCVHKNNTDEDPIVIEAISAEVAADIFVNEFDILDEEITVWLMSEPLIFETVVNVRLKV